MKLDIKYIMVMTEIPMHVLPNKTYTHILTHTSYLNTPTICVLCCAMQYIEIYIYSCDANLTSKQPFCCTLTWIVLASSSFRSVAFLHNSVQRYFRPSPPLKTSFARTFLLFLYLLLRPTTFQFPLNSIVFHLSSSTGLT